MDSQQEQKLNERLGQWVAGQGFWFQLLHPVAGVSITGRVLQLASKLGLYLLIALILGAGIFYKSLNSGKYLSKVESSLKKGLHAQEMMLSGMSQSPTEFKIGSLAALGQENTFFRDLSLRDLRCNLDLKSYLTGKWKIGMVEMDRLDLSLRVGADDDAKAHEMGRMVFSNMDAEIRGLHASHASLQWGWSPQTYGCVLDSDLTVRRGGEGWRVYLRGGTFSQNWLRDLRVLEISAMVTRDRILFEKATFATDEGSLDFGGLVIECSSNPRVNGKLKIRHLTHEHLFPQQSDAYVSGMLSGDFEVSGFLNTARGVTLDGRVFLQAPDHLQLTQKVPLLEALTVADGMNRYRRPDFTEGSFLLRTESGGMQVSALKLKAGELLQLEGGFGSHSAKSSGVQQDVSRQLWLSENLRLSEIGENSEGAAQEKSLDSSEETALLKVMNPQRSSAAAERQAIMVLQDLRYDGMVRLIMDATAFSRAPGLREILLKDLETGRLILDVPLEGTAAELTQKQALEIIERARLTP